MDETVSDETQGPQTAPDASEGLEDFDAFWKARNRKRKTTRIMGEVVELPASLPLQYQLEAERLKRSKRDQDVHKLVALLFGEDAFARWAGKGMDIEQFQVLLAWAPQAIAGGTMTLAQVADELAAYQAEGGKGSKGKAKGAKPRKP